MDFDLIIKPNFSFMGKTTLFNFSISQLMILLTIYFIITPQ